MSLSPLEYPLTAESRLFFLHIPKTAGMTLNAILEQHFDKKGYAAFLFQRNFPEIPGCYFKTYRYYCGHFDYDLICKLLPGEIVWVTFLREPVERFLSAFAYTQRILFSPAPREQLATWLGSYVNLYRLDVTEFVDHPDMPAIAQNRQTQMLGSRFKVENYAELMAAISRLQTWNFKSFESLKIEDSAECLLAQAKQQLAKAVFFGLTERFQDSLHLLAYTFGWRPQRDEIRLNVAPSRPRQADLTAETLEKVIDVNRLDMELYAFAQQLFETRFNRMSYELLERYGGRPHALLQPPLPPEIMFELLEKHYANRLTERQSPARSFSLSMEQAISGTGWQQREQHPQYGSFRWSGPGHCSTLDMPLAADGDKRVILAVAAAITPETLNSLSLRINEHLVPLQRHSGREGAVIFTGDLPQSSLAAGPGFTRLTFEIERTLSPAALTGSTDDRLLGLALNRLEVHPAAADDPGWADACARLIAPATVEQMPHLALQTDVITTGRGWYPVEVYQGEAFCWINNNAELIIHAPTGRHTRLSLEVEPGPGLAGQPLRLQLLNEGGQVMAEADEVADRQVIEVELPFQPSPTVTFRLHLEGGGQPAPRDPRILNFRVFRFGWA